ncbi:Lpg1974 family pore-forming outer membrane protein [Thermodesulfobacteriota bacterium]
MGISVISRTLSLFVLAGTIVGLSSLGWAQGFAPPGTHGTGLESLGDVVQFPGRDQGYSASVELLWLRPSSSKLLYAVKGPAAGGGVVGTLEGFKPGRDLGFRLSSVAPMGYPGSAVEVHYSHLTSHQEVSKERGAGEIWGLLIHANAPVDDNNVTELLASTSFALRQGAVGSKVSFRFGSGGNLHLSAGVQFTHLNQGLSVKYFDSNDEERVEVFRENTLTGAGPRFILGTSWRMGAVNLYGAIGTALLVGRLSGNGRETDFFNGGRSFERVNVDMAYGIRIVPTLSAKLGVDCGYQADWGSVGLYGGYEVHNYFSAVSYYEFYDDVDAQIGANDQSDIGIDGFFLGCKMGCRF